jgi:hypothetical protein
MRDVFLFEQVIKPNTLFASVTSLCKKLLTFSVLGDVILFYLNVTVNCIMLISPGNDLYCVNFPQESQTTQGQMQPVRPFCTELSIT